MLALTYARLATVDELFQYKHQGFTLDEFPGYTPDQWGIKAHNRPWIEGAGQFKNGQRIIEVGGAYSLLPKYLADKYDLEAWIGDDFGKSSGESLWSRWGNPEELPERYPSVKYVFEPFGIYSSHYPDQYFDCIFSVSTLEHIPHQKRVDVLKDMNRCLKPGGIQLHTIDIKVAKPRRFLLDVVTGKIPILSSLSHKGAAEIRNWIKAFEDSGIKMRTAIPNALALLDRSTLVESPDVVYKFYPPRNEPKPYKPSASLLVRIESG